MDWSNLAEYRDHWQTDVNMVMDLHISLGRGIWQGDGLSATLFNLILHRALKNLEQTNMIVNRLTQICGYADDILIIGRSLPGLEALCVEISRESGRVGLVIKSEKTKCMRFSASPSRRSVKGATINGVTYEGVADFIYLYTLINNDNGIEKEIQRRILAGSRTYFAAINLFRSQLLSRATKIILYKTLIRPVVSYGAEAWTLTKKEEQALLIFEMKIFRRIYGPKYENGELRSRDESRTRRDEQRRKYSKMDKRAKDKLVRSPRENGGG